MYIYVILPRCRLHSIMPSLKLVLKGCPTGWEISGMFDFVLMSRCLWHLSFAQIWCPLSNKDLGGLASKGWYYKSKLKIYVVQLWAPNKWLHITEFWVVKRFWTFQGKMVYYCQSAKFESHRFKFCNLSSLLTSENASPAIFQDLLSVNYKENGAQL